MKSIKHKTTVNKLALCAAMVIGLGVSSRAQTPIYSVSGSGGTGGGTAGVAVAPSTSPAGSSTLTDLGGTTQFTFGPGPGGVGQSIIDGVTGQAGAGVLAGTLGASSSLSAFTLTMWVNLASGSTINNYRFLEIALGSPPTTGTADGTLLFLGLNSGGGVQAYVNNVNGNSTATDIATANTWNNGGTLGAMAANDWYFVAFTYDTVGGSSLLYSGDTGDAATLAYTFNNLSGGVLDLSSATSISLLDRFSGGRNFPGAIADVNIYSGSLALAQIQAIQISEVPEPTTLAMLGLGSLAGVMAIRRRRS